MPSPMSSEVITQRLNDHPGVVRLTQITRPKPLSNRCIQPTCTQCALIRRQISPLAIQSRSKRKYSGPITCNRIINGRMTAR